MDNVDWELLLSELIAIYEFGFIPGYFIGVILTLAAWEQEDERREINDINSEQGS